MSTRRDFIKAVAAAPPVLRSGLKDQPPPPIEKIIITPDDDSGTRIEIKQPPLAVCAVQGPQQGDYCVDNPTLIIDRPADLLHLMIEFQNLRLLLRARTVIPNPGLIQRPAPKLIPSGDPILAIVTLPSQHVREGSWAEDSGNTQPKSRQVLAESAEASRLVFRLPQREMPLLLRELLNWNAWTPVLQPIFDDTGRYDTRVIAPPDGLQTAILLPDPLVITPKGDLGWAHRGDARTDPALNEDDQEIWHSRLGVKDGRGGIDEVSEAERAIHAVWTREFLLPAVACDLSKELDAITHCAAMAIVRLSTGGKPPLGTTDPNQVSATGMPPQPIPVELLHLSALGGSLRAQAMFPANDWLDEWSQATAFGRDTETTLVKKGFLFPYGHPASLIRTTERKVQREMVGNELIAGLRTRVYIRVTTPTMEYGESGLVKVEGGVPLSIDRSLPFTSIRLSPTQTPPLDLAGFTIAAPAAGCTDCGDPSADKLVPRVGGKPFLFDMHVIDHAGKEHLSRCPVVWVANNSRLRDTTFQDGVSNMYATLVAGLQDPQHPAPECPFNGQHVAFARESSAGDTTIETAAMGFEGLWSLNQDIQTAAQAQKALGLTEIRSDGPSCTDEQRAARPIRPRMTTSRVRSQATRSLAGSSSSPQEGTDFSYHEGFLQHGLPGTPDSSDDGNRGEVMFKLSLPRPGIPDLPRIHFSLPSDRSVGLMQPDFDIVGFSRQFGILTGSLPDPRALLDSIRVGFVDVDNIKNMLGSTKLFGALPLGSLLPPITDLKNSLPGLTSEIEKDGRGLPKAVVTTYRHESDLLSDQGNGSGDFAGVFLKLGALKTDTKPRLTLKAMRRTPIQPSEDSLLETSISVTGFTLKIANVVNVAFESISMVMKSGTKPSVVPRLATPPMTFEGQLSFLSDLETQLHSLLPAAFGPKGPAIAVTPDGVSITTTIGLPAITLGAFSLVNLGINAGVVVPFSGDPLRFRFALCDRHRPFSAAVTILGGGGFFGMTVSSRGIEVIEFAIEAGGIAAISVAFVHGEVYAFIGVYFAIHKLPDGSSSVVIAAYIRFGGHVDIAGLIAVSLEVYIALQYNNRPSQLEGSAQLRVCIKIAFFRRTFEASVRRTFAGSQNKSLRLPPPTLRMSQAQWSLYCDAFEGASGCPT
jgi:hypothetical protein